MTITLDQQRFERLRMTRTLRGEGMVRWQSIVVAVVGAGVLGGRTAIELAMSGANVRLYDPDVGSIENTGTAWVRPGVPKVESVAALCNSIRPGSAVGVARDIRQIGIGEIAQCYMLIDCSDAPALTVPLTLLTNGIGLPMLRGALSGDGETELGRVQCSLGGAGYSCAMCTYDVAQVFSGTRQHHCLPATPELPATLAGGAMAAMTAGALVISAQRLVTENDIDQVLDRELLLDMTGGQFLSLTRKRSRRCISGHRRWELTQTRLNANDATFLDVFNEADHYLDRPVACVQPYAQPLCVAATCQCGTDAKAVGTRWAQPPKCPTCGAAMLWRRESARQTLTRQDVASLHIENVPLAELGLPEGGAMLVAAGEDQSTVNLLLA